jgi:hypothetical protein
VYLRGTVSINLKGTQVKMKPPKNFFGGVANLLTRKSWDSPEERETFKIMALTQANYRVLRDLGVDNVARIAVGDVIIYEDMEGKPNDFPLAMEALKNKVDSGLDLGYLEKFDLILRHDDGVLSYVIDFDIYREHEPGVDPITIRVTALSSKLRRGRDESEDEYMERVKDNFRSQEDFDEFKNGLQQHFEGFLDQIRDRLNARLGIEEIKIDWNTCLIRKERKNEQARNWTIYTDYGYPFYAYNPVLDLYYLSVWSNLFYDRGFQAKQFAYVDPDGSVLATSDNMEWTSNDFDSFVVSDSGAGAEMAETAVKSDSGGGGWLDDVSDCYSSDSDSGGGGDAGDDGGSCSSCSGCGGCGGD